MAAPTKFTQGLAREPQEDCRDYLRTGRCKYGASCKYNHPPNVQSGGGLKPLDPSAPQFPIRPGQPNCQYYMKHATCKFGQACKFNHPPQSEVTAALLGGSTVVVNVGGRNSKGVSQPVVLNSLGDSVSAASATALQFLPQRPDEPDCIYFLRNGRCKYGATCRYHHPVSFAQASDAQGSQDRRQQRTSGSTNVIGDSSRLNPTRRVQESVQGTSQYTRSQQPSQGFVQQARQRDPGVPAGAATHFIVTETPLAVMSETAPGPSSSYHRMSRSNSVGDEYSVPLNTSGMPVGRGYTSSSSSIASSYETAVSAPEGLLSSVQPGQGEANGSVWSRPVRRIGSGGSLSAYDSTPPLRPQVPYVTSRSTLVPSVSDNSIASRGIRAESIGSASDNSAVLDDAWNSGTQSNSGRGWIERNPSFEQARRSRNSQLDRSERKLPQDSRFSQSSLQGREHRARVARDGESHDDGGLSMMTSALLNMLDTPEEAAMKSYTSHEPSLRTQPRVASPPSTPRRGHISYSKALEGPPPPQDYYLSSSSARESYSRAVAASERQPSGHYITSNQYTLDASPTQSYMNDPNASFSHTLQTSRDETSSNISAGDQDRPSPTWSPTWQGAVPQPRQDQVPPAQPMAVLQQPSRTQGSQHHSPDIVLYLP